MKKYVIVIAFNNIKNPEDLRILLSEGETGAEALYAAMKQDECIELFGKGYFLNKWSCKELLT